MKLWNRYPALFYGLAALAGVACHFHFFFPLLAGLLGGKHIRTIGFYLIVLASFFNTSLFVNKPFKNLKAEGIGYYQCKKVRHTVSLERDGLNYQGLLTYFVSGKKTYRNLPCYISVDDIENRPRGDRDYIVEGRVTEIGHGLYKMRVTHWKMVDNTFNLSEIRFYLKEKLRGYLKREIKHMQTYAFFASLGTGELENRLLSAHFSRAGLNHTLAISGFHYTYLIIALSAFFGLFFRKKPVCYFLIIFITVYFLFIGETPSLNRAWMASLVYLIAYVIGQRSTGLNALGLALLASLTLDPMAIIHIGFQMSYLATFAILSLYHPLDALIQKIMPKRKLTEVRKMPYLDQHGYILSALIRQSIALTIPVNLVTIPLNLYHFHYFPWMALFFNLFFPMAITIPLLSLIIAVTVPVLGTWILHGVAHFVKGLIGMVFYGMGVLDGGIWNLTMGSCEAGIWVMAMVAGGLIVDEWRYRLTLIRGVA